MTPCFQLHRSIEKLTRFYVLDNDGGVTKQEPAVTGTSINVHSHDSGVETCPKSPVRKLGSASPVPLSLIFCSQDVDYSETLQACTYRTSCSVLQAARLCLCLHSEADMLNDINMLFTLRWDSFCSTVQFILPAGGQENGTMFGKWEGCHRLNLIF